MITCPVEIENSLRLNSAVVDDVLVLPAELDNFVIESYNGVMTNLKIDELNERVEQIGVRDPFIHRVFDVDGVGEGLVLTPYTKTGVSRDLYSGTVCKLKTAAHRVQKTKHAASRVIEVPAGTMEFVEMFVTPQRIEQAVNETGADNMKATRDVISWMHQDILKESVNELEEMGIKYDAIAKFTTPAIVKQYHDYLSRVR